MSLMRILIGLLLTSGALAQTHPEILDANGNEVAVLRSLHDLAK